MACVTIPFTNPGKLGTGFRGLSGAEADYFEPQVSPEYIFEDIVGKSAALQKVLKQVAIVAPAGSTVLLYGETGTGRELIARAIHNLSSRRKCTLVRINCAAIPSGLVESELFGHERGAFTGALIQKKGRFERADGGSLFLDEIDDIPLELQPKLLRAVQEQEFERLGSCHTINVNVRMIAATHRDLQIMIRSNHFREDLFYRLNVFPIEIPPLRERREDILLLAHYFEMVDDQDGLLYFYRESRPLTTVQGYGVWRGVDVCLQNVVVMQPRILIHDHLAGAMLGRISLLPIRTG